MSTIHNQDTGKRASARFDFYRTFRLNTDFYPLLQYPILRRSYSSTFGSIDFEVPMTSTFGSIDFDVPMTSTFGAIDFDVLMTSTYGIIDFDVRILRRSDLLTSTSLLTSTYGSTDFDRLYSAKFVLTSTGQPRINTDFYRLLQESIGFNVRVGRTKNVPHSLIL